MDQIPSYPPAEGEQQGLNSASQQLIQEELSTPQALVEAPQQQRDSERFYCPFPGCNRSFAELWRLKVHYRAPPDIRGSGKERGHGTELGFCPKCAKALKPGKHHVGCSAGRATPRQTKRKAAEDNEADGPKRAESMPQHFPWPLDPATAQAAAAHAAAAHAAAAAAAAAGMPINGAHYPPLLPPGLIPNGAVPGAFPPGPDGANFWGANNPHHAAASAAALAAAAAAFAAPYGAPGYPGQPFGVPGFPPLPPPGAFPAPPYPQGGPQGPPGSHGGGVAPPPPTPQPSQSQVPQQPLLLPPPSQPSQGPQSTSQQPALPGPSQAQQNDLHPDLYPRSQPQNIPAATPGTTSNLDSSEPEFLAGIFDDLPEFSRVVPSPPPLPDDFHMNSGPNRMLFNFSQFSQKMPQSLQDTHTRELTEKEAHDLAEQHVVYDHTDDGELMQMLFGMADDVPTMATIHLHAWHNVDDDAMPPHAPHPSRVTSGAQAGPAPSPLAAGSSGGGPIAAAAAAGASHLANGAGGSGMMMSMSPRGDMHGGGMQQHGMVQGHTNGPLTGMQQQHGRAPDSTSQHQVGIHQGQQGDNQGQQGHGEEGKRLEGPSGEFINKHLDILGNCGDERDHVLEAEMHQFLQSVE